MAVTAERGKRSSVRNRRFPNLRQADSPYLTKSQIAELTCDDIQAMSEDELIQIIVSARPCPVSEDVAERLEYYDRATLERLAFLTRRLCRREGY